MQAQPHFTTLVACCKRPTTERISPFMAFFLGSQFSISLWMRRSFSFGKWISIQLVSKVIPKKVKLVEGSSTFSRAKGSPSLSHTSVKICKFWLHVEEWGLVAHSQEIIQVMYGRGNSIPLVRGWCHKPYIITTRPHTLLAKMDTKTAFRLLPVDLADRYLLYCSIGMGKCYIPGHFSSLWTTVQSTLKLFNILVELLYTYLHIIL